MFRTLVLFLILTAASVSSGNTQEYRLGLDPPSFEIYKSMLEFAENEKFDKISGSWGFLGRVPDEIRDKFGVELEVELNDAVRERNKPAALTAVRKLVYYDMKDIFSVILHSNEEDAAQLKGLIKVAYLDYLHLSPEVEKTNLELDTRIKNSFKEAFAVFSESETDGEIAPDSARAERARPLFARIENDVLEVFPDFSLTFTTPPMLTRRAKPVYPSLAREAGIEGTVLIKVVISPEGKVVGATVMESDVSTTMEEEALRAARLCEFEPARNGNLKVASTVVIPFNFRL